MGGDAVKSAHWIAALAAAISARSKGKSETALGTSKPNGEGGIRTPGTLTRTLVFETSDQNAQGQPSSEVTVSLDDHWRTHWRKALQKQPDLRAVVDAWPTLPDPVKVGIVAMVRAASEPRG